MIQLHWLAKGQAKNGRLLSAVSPNLKDIFCLAYAQQTTKLAITELKLFYRSITSSLVTLRYIAE